MKQKNEKTINIKQQIKMDLLKLQDKKYKVFIQNLCPGTENIIGIKIPIIRKYAKELLR